MGHVNRARCHPLGRLNLNLHRLDVVHLITQAIGHGITRYEVQTEHSESQGSGYRVRPGYVPSKANGNAGGRDQTHPHHIYLTGVGQMCHVKTGGPLPRVVRISHQHATTVFGQRAAESECVAANHIAINFQIERLQLCQFQTRLGAGNLVRDPTQTIANSNTERYTSQVTFINRGDPGCVVAGIGHGATIFLNVIVVASDIARVHRGRIR